MYQHNVPADDPRRTEPTLTATAIAAVLPVVVLVAVTYPTAAVGVVAGFALASAYTRL
ncbi:MAG: hypothetical protein J07HB67_00953 [halophilic archaeon J07HB67]|jgi:hypothetical protein|nr:MAG: hypothetical protein J07HB67_00953 [halophilic archaeon J07HB67]